VLLAFATALISGVSVYVAKLGTQAVPDPFVYTTARNMVVGLALLIILIASGSAGQVATLKRQEWVRLGLIGLIGGSLPFLLFFWGLTMTTAAEASLIQKTQFLWVAAIAIPLLGESFGIWQAVALAALLGGTLLQGGMPDSFGTGEMLVLAATLFWSAEVVLARRVLRTVTPAVGAFARMGGGAIVMLIFLAASGRIGGLLEMGPSAWLWVIGPSILLLGYVLTWYNALSRAPATVVTSVLALGAPVTALIASGVTGSVAPPATVSVIALTVGVALTIYALEAMSRRRAGIATRAS
jgi:drug/metabolite transporter (DMT)-like permease